MSLRTAFKISTLSISGAIIGGVTGQLFSRYIIRPDIVEKNTFRWYVGTFSAMFMLGAGAVFLPYKIMGGIKM